jgi:hypothetical protein
MNGVTKWFGLAVLTAGVVSCGQGAPPQTTRALEGGSVLEIAVHYDVLKEGGKPNGAWNEGEPLLEGQRLTVTTLHPETFEPLGEPREFVTSGDVLKLEVPSGLQRIHLQEIAPEDPSLRWFTSSARTWFVDLGRNPFGRVQIPTFCAKNGEVILGAGDALRCHGEKFIDNTPPPLPTFTLETQTPDAGKFFAVNQLFATECSHDSNAERFRVVVNPQIVGLQGNVTVQIDPPLYTPGITVTPATQAISVSNQPRTSFRLETRRVPATWTSVTVSGRLGQTGYSRVVPLDVNAALEGAPGDCFAQLEGRTDAFNTVATSSDAVYAAHGNVVRQYPLGKTTTAQTWTLPNIQGHPVVAIRVAPSPWGAVYVTAYTLISSSPTLTLEGRLYRISGSSVASVLSFSTNEVPTLIAFEGAQLYIGTVRFDQNAQNNFGGSRLLEVDQSGTIQRVVYDSRVAGIADLLSTSSGVMYGVQEINATPHGRLMHAQRGVLCNTTTAVMDLATSATGELYISTRDAVLNFDATTSSCPMVTQQWAKDRLLAVRGSNALYAANPAQDDVILAGGGQALYPNQPIPKAAQMADFDGRLWIATETGLYRMTP